MFFYTFLKHFQFFWMTPDNFFVFRLAIANFVVNSHHEYEVVPREAVVRLLEDGLEEERVLGQPLHGPHQDVEKAEPVAVLHQGENSLSINGVICQ